MRLSNIFTAGMTLTSSQLRHYRRTIDTLHKRVLLIALIFLNGIPIFFSHSLNKDRYLIIGLCRSDLVQYICKQIILDIECVRKIMQLHSNLIRKLWLTPKPCQYNQKFIRKIPVLDNVCSDQLSSILFLMGVGLNSIILLTRFGIIYLFT